MIFFTAKNRSSLKQGAHHNETRYDWDAVCNRLKFIENTESLF